MRIVIVDDEHLARAVVREYLAPHADAQIVAECANGFEAVKAIVELAPDLVLLDIQMPKLTGFEVVELAGSKPRYIFVTAYDQYALKAFEVHAIDYLLKPFAQVRFDQALAHARASLGQVPSTQIAALMQELATRHPQLERILIRDGAKVHILPIHKVEYIEAQDDYIQIRSEGKSWLKSQRLSDLENSLDAGQFVRIHRSFIVNIEFISRILQISKDSHAAILHDGSKLPISRSGYQRVKNLIA